jgi:hypothetical protein
MIYCRRITLTLSYVLIYITKKGKRFIDFVNYCSTQISIKRELLFSTHTFSLSRFCWKRHLNLFKNKKKKRIPFNSQIINLVISLEPVTQPFYNPPLKLLISPSFIFLFCFHFFHSHARLLAFERNEKKCCKYTENKSIRIKMEINVNNSMIRHKSDLLIANAP